MYMYVHVCVSATAEVSVNKTREALPLSPLSSESGGNESHIYSHFEKTAGAREQRVEVMVALPAFYSRTLLPSHYYLHSPLPHYSYLQYVSICKYIYIFICKYIYIFIHVCVCIYFGKYM